MPTCSSCGAEILFCTTKNGKQMPVDPTPVPNGNLELDGENVRVVKPDPNVMRHVSHYATCIHAKQHRKK